MKEPVIVSAVRTPLGAFNGSLATTGATDLGAMVINEAIGRAGIDAEIVNEVIMGQVLPCGYGQNPARQAAVRAGLPWDVGCETVNKVCGSGLKSVMMAAQAIACGDAEVVVAGGMETMSMAPYYLDAPLNSWPDNVDKARFGYRMGPGRLEDHMIHDGLWDIVNDFHMGVSNELSSEKYGVSRKDQDRYAEMSYSRALEAVESGRFYEETMAVAVKGKKGKTHEFARDENPVPTDYDTLSKMKPAFTKNGVGTAGNASIISDGAAAVVVMSRDKAEKLGCDIIAGIGAQAAAGIDMKYVLMAPIHAVPRCLKKEGIGVGDVDLYEINEAFSGSTVGVLRELSLDPEIVNVNGGSVALGHPIGASGCRVLVTLLYEMRRRDVKTGLASLCLGGGEAVAMIVKR
ncbi:MAG: acetyl-CoA C-acetyltransferase [Thermodesulfobacteriota bacterium]